MSDRTDTEIKSDAMALLRTSLGLVDSERFIMLVHQERMDYTQWRQSQWSDESVSEIAEKARKVRSNGRLPGQS